jgi:DNA-binding transcriptional MerR regulator
MDPQNIRKLYYSISEVSRITSVRKQLLRSWEADFSELRPGKNRAGNRVYRLHDIKTIFMIKRLLFDEKYTIEGAKQKLRALKKQRNPQQPLTLEDMQKNDILLEVKRDLQELLEYITNISDNNEQEMRI